MKIKIVRQVIERYDTPNNRNKNNTIKSINKVVIGEFNTNHIPQKEEVINFENKNYTVLKVIRAVGKYNEEFTIQVMPYNTQHFNSHGSDSWYETIPLVTDIE